MMVIMMMIMTTIMIIIFIFLHHPHHSHHHHHHPRVTRFGLGRADAGQRTYKPQAPKSPPKSLTQRPLAFNPTSKAQHLKPLTPKTRSLVNPRSRATSHQLRSLQAHAGTPPRPSRQLGEKDYLLGVSREEEGI